MMTYSCNKQHATEETRSALLTCEGLVSCQVAAIQQVQVAGKRQVLAEAAAGQYIACQLCQIHVSK